MNLKDELIRYGGIVDNGLEKILPKEGSYQKKVLQAMRYSVFAGGKRLRPILTLKTCELICGDYTKALAAALSVEMIHTYSLIHDDLPAMDNDDFRRGKPTNHKAYGEAIAILAGDGLLNYAYETMFSSLNESNEDCGRYAMAFREISRASGVFGMIGGQTADIIAEEGIINKEILDYIHRNKTSALIEASITAGAIIGGATEKELESLRKYGKAIGLGYQIRDDILDKVGDINKLGKDIGSDEENKKLTYLSLYGFDESVSKTKELCKIAEESMSLFESKHTSFFIDLAKYLVDRES